jgi:hypothetical protein
MMLLQTWQIGRDTYTLCPRPSRGVDTHHWQRPLHQCERAFFVPQGPEIAPYLMLLPIAMHIAAGGCAMSFLFIVVTGRTVSSKARFDHTPNLHSWVLDRSFRNQHCRWDSTDEIVMSMLSSRASCNMSPLLQLRGLPVSIVAVSISESPLCRPMDALSSDVFARDLLWNRRRKFSWCWLACRTTVRTGTCLVLQAMWTSTFKTSSLSSSSSSAIDKTSSRARWMLLRALLPGGGGTTPAQSLFLSVVHRAAVFLTNGSNAIVVAVRVRPGRC